MKSLLFILCFLLSACFTEAQVYITIVFHTDLTVRQIENTAVKQACLAEYGAKLKQIENDRAVTSADLAIVEEIQARLVKSFANCDDAIRNGKTLYYAFQRLPKIYDNLQKAAGIPAAQRRRSEIENLRLVIFDNAGVVATEIVAAQHDTVRGARARAPTMPQPVHQRQHGPRPHRRRTAGTPAPHPTNQTHHQTDQDHRCHNTGLRRPDAGPSRLRPHRHQFGRPCKRCVGPAFWLRRCRPGARPVRPLTERQSEPLGTPRRHMDRWPRG